MSHTLTCLHHARRESSHLESPAAMHKGTDLVVALLVTMFPFRPSNCAHSRELWGRRIRDKRSQIADLDEARVHEKLVFEDVPAYALRARRTASSHPDSATAKGILRLEVPQQAGGEECAHPHSR